jgi:hypothetical protein
MLATGMFLSACAADRETLVGRYEAEDSQGQKISLELAPEGRGVWRHQGETVRFSWSLRHGNIFFHTGSGGVVEGELLDHGLKVMFPGHENYVFRPQ